MLTSIFILTYPLSRSNVDIVGKPYVRTIGINIYGEVGVRIIMEEWDGTKRSRILQTLGV